MATDVSEAEADGLDYERQRVAQWRRDTEQLRAELDAARRASRDLAAFVEHRAYCPRRDPRWGYQCNCGLDAAMARLDLPACDR